MESHEIDYRIIGDDMQCVEIELDANEVVIAEPGAMMYMDQSIEMQTLFGDGSKKTSGIFDKILGMGKRMITGESLFMTAFAHTGWDKAQVTFAAPIPGKIIPFDLTQFGGQIICQKEAFLCAAKGVSVGIHFQKKIGVGLFGGEGFIMQKLEGDGMAFCNAGGSIVQRKLKPGERLKIDTGCLVALTKDVHYNIEFVGGIKNTLFGGEGVFYATVEGPGMVWMQTLPFSRLANKIIASASNIGGKRRGEGSILGGLGDLLDGRD